MSSFDSTTRYTTALSRKQRRQKAMQPVSVSMSGGGSAPLGGVVTLTGDQEISGLKDFINGLTIGGLPIRKINENTVFIDANVAFGGAATMFGKGSTTFPTIWANIPIDGNTIGRNEQGELYVIGGTGGGGGVADSVAWSNITGKPTWIGADKPSYSYSEITGTPDLGGFVTTESLTELLSGKADKATTLAEYGITDAYTKDELNAEFEKYMLKDTAQPITAQHNFTNGLLIDGLAIRKSADKTFYFDGNIVVSGAITMFGKDSTTFPTIWANIPFNPKHMTWDGSQWNVEGGGSASVTYNAVIKALGFTPYNATNPNGYITSADSITGNAGSATKLQTRRTIWGKDFDGTDGISGDLIVGGDGNAIMFSSTGGYTYSVLKSSVAENTLSIGEGSTSGGLDTTIYGRSIILRFGANKTSGITLNSSGDVHIANNIHLKGGAIRDKNGYWMIGESTNGGGEIAVGSPSLVGNRTLSNSNGKLSLLASGNVVVGGDTADEKLHIYGNVKATSFIGNLTGTSDSSNKLRIVDYYNSIDLNTILTGGGVVHNYGSINYWVNAPQRPQYGSCAQFQAYNTTSHQLSGQLFWDVNHGSTTDCTRSLWWRAADTNGWTNSKWHQIAFTDSNSLSPSSGLLTVNGSLLTTGAITFFSQASLKNIINHEGLSLDELSKIQPARFKWKDGRDERVHVGVIAEDILPILPEVVYFTGEEKTKTVDYASLATHIGVSLIKPVIDHETRIKYLEAEVQALKEENNKLKQLVA